MQSSLCDHVRSQPWLASHDFYSVLEDPRTVVGGLRAFVQQQYAMSVSLSQAFYGLLARAPALAWCERLAVAEMAAEETWGLGDRNHGAAFLHLAKTLGGESELGRGLRQETIDAFATRTDLALGRYGHSFSESCLIIAAGNEFANTILFARIHQAIKKSGELKLANEPYFRAHLNDEEGHMQRLFEIADTVTAGSDFDRVIGGLDLLLLKRKEFFDGVVAEFKAADEARPVAPVGAG